jgi:hypothetical protein
LQPQGAETTWTPKGSDIQKAEQQVEIENTVNAVEKQRDAAGEVEYSFYQVFCVSLSLSPSLPPLPPLSLSLTLFSSIFGT